MGDPAPPEAQREAPPQLALTRWVGIVSVFVAPTTIITALCFYFGYVSARAELSYFGVDSNVLGYGSGDYVLKSVEVLYPPLVGFLAVWALGLWAGQYARRLQSRGEHTRTLLCAARTLAVVGAVLLGWGLLGVVWPGIAESVGGAATTPMALALGIGAIALGRWIKRGLRGGRGRPTTNAERATWGIGLVIVVLALFWMANIFATTDGVDRAESTAADLWTRESTLTLYTEFPLDAPKELIVEHAPEISDTAVGTPTPVYRYECFRGLAVKGNRWILVPARWTPEFGYAAIVDVGPTARLSVTRLKGMTDGPAGDWNAAWVCPEVAPAQ